jgi:transcriptional/translational regulatory protein YebC/TACO1
VAIFIETITDNKNRTVAEIRHVLSKFGGSLGQNGSVAWNFDKTGIVLIEDSNMTEEEALNLSVKVDAVDFKLEDKYFKIFFDHDMLYEKIELIEKNGLEIDSSFIELLPKNFVEVSEEKFLTIKKLFDSLEDLEDIQNVYSNYRVEKN